MHSPILDRISSITPSHAAFRKLGHYLVAISVMKGGMGMSAERFELKRLKSPEEVLKFDTGPLTLADLSMCVGPTRNAMTRELPGDGDLHR